MIQNILKYSILFGLIFGIVSCDKLIFDNLEEKFDDESKVYILVTRAAHINGEESINEDIVDFEDRVHDMALFVFDSANGELVGEPYFESNIPITNKSKTFAVPLTPGQRDFYFVANMPIAELETIATKSALEDYMKLTEELDEDLYLSATETKGFPMSRVYPDQTIVDGGTIYNPTPFRPDNEERVKLRRVVAQLQVDIDGTEISSVKNVYFKNAFRKFSLLPLDQPIPSPEFYVETATNNALRKSVNSYIYYMPEALMSNPVWTATDHKPINYFVIEAVTGTTYEIPIITYEGTIPGNNYLSFARGEQTEQPDYNIYRNHRYVYTIKSLEDIQINYVINPWTLVQSSFYMGYGYNVGVDEEGSVTISNTVLACDPHKVTIRTKTGFTFEGGGTEQEFTNTDSDASATYKVTPIPATGEVYLEVYYNDALVKTFTR